MWAKNEIKHNNSSPLNNTSDTTLTYTSNFKQRTLENCKLFSNIKAVRDPVIELRFFEDRCKIYEINDDSEKFEILQKSDPILIL